MEDGGGDGGVEGAVVGMGMGMRGARCIVGAERCV